MIRILLADDHDLVREALHHLLETSGNIEVVGEASNGHDALRLVRTLQPDVVLMDLSMPGLDGIETTKQIVGEKLKARVLILTMHTAEEYAVRVLQAGAYGFIGKRVSRPELVEAVCKVAAGEYYLPSELSHGLPKRYARNGAPASPLEALSDRELQVLKYLAEGHKGKAIAKKLHLSVKTVDTYRARLLAKLNLHTVADLVRFALRYGIIEDVW